MTPLASPPTPRDNGSDRLSLLQSTVYWLAPAWIYSRPPAVARRNRGFRLISMTHEIVPTRFGHALGFPHLRAGYEGAARRWDSIQTGEAVMDAGLLDWLERIWLASIGAKPALEFGVRRRAHHRDRSAPDLS